MGLDQILILFKKWKALSDEFPSPSGDEAGEETMEAIQWPQTASMGHRPSLPPAGSDSDEDELQEFYVEEILDIRIKVNDHIIDCTLLVTEGALLPGTLKLP